MEAGRRSACFAALGTTALVAVEEPAALAAAVSLLRRGLDEIDRACSRFREDSELSRLNRSGGRPVQVSPLLVEALGVALRAADITDGDVDPTLGSTMRDLGYDRDFALVVDGGAGAPPRAVRARGRWRDVRLDPARRRAQLPPGVSLDLGATAKALAADRAARAIGGATGVGTLVSLGGDIAVCGRAPAGGWAVLVTEDHRRPDGAGETIGLHEGGLATSSTTVRRWRAGEARVHHVIDPRRGVPAAEVWRTVSVAAASCVDANIASTAAIVRGRAAPAWLESAGLPARLVAGDGSVLRVGRWPEPPA